MLKKQKKKTKNKKHNYYFCNLSSNQCKKRFKSIKDETFWLQWLVNIWLSVNFIVIIDVFYIAVTSDNVTGTLIIIIIIFHIEHE